VEKDGTFFPGFHCFKFLVFFYENPGNPRNYWPLFIPPPNFCPKMVKNPKNEDLNRLYHLFHGTVASPQFGVFLRFPEVDRYCLFPFLSCSLNPPFLCLSVLPSTLYFFFARIRPTRFHKNNFLFVSLFFSLVTFVPNPPPTPEGVVSTTDSVFASVWGGEQVKRLPSQANRACPCPPVLGVFFPRLFAIFSGLPPTFLQTPFFLLQSDDDGRPLTRTIPERSLVWSWRIAKVFPPPPPFFCLKIFFFAH